MVLALCSAARKIVPTCPVSWYYQVPGRNYGSRCDPLTDAKLAACLLLSLSPLLVEHVCVAQLKKKSPVSAAFELCVAMEPKTRPKFEFQDPSKKKTAVSKGGTVVTTVVTVVPRPSVLIVTCSNNSSYTTAVATLTVVSTVPPATAVAGEERKTFVRI